MEVRVRKRQDGSIRDVIIIEKSSTFKITSSINGGITINKHSNDDDHGDGIVVYPRYSNEIEVE